MILVFGGTTEGKQVASILDRLEKPYFYSTKTHVNFSGKGKPIYGAMTVDELYRFCKKNQITQLINAAHPFAAQLHDTIAEIASTTISILRFERQFPPRTNHALVTYTPDFDSVLTHIQEKGYTSLLALSGVQTIEKLKPYWTRYPTWFRILDSISSRAIAEKNNFPKTNLIFGYPQVKAEEISLIAQLRPKIIFTKESGYHGKQQEKIAAAIHTKTPIVVLQQPPLSKKYLCIQTEEKLIASVH